LQRSCNTFISYYSYGSVLGLALDLSLRENDLNLDNYMKLVWNTFGKNEKPYNIQDLHSRLNMYAGQEFGDHFFNSYIYKSNMPDMKRLFNNVGISLTQDKSKVTFGASIQDNIIVDNPRINSSAYNSRLEKGDKLLQVESFTLNNLVSINQILNKYKPKDRITIVYERYGNTRETTVTLQENLSYTISLFEASDLELDDKKRTNRNAWLNIKE